MTPDAPPHILRVLLAPDEIMNHSHEDNYVCLTCRRTFASPIQATRVACEGGETT